MIAYMKKKLNKKFKFALATLGAFAVCCVSAYSALEELNHEPLQAYAIDSPTTDNPVVNGIFTFSNVGSYQYTLTFDDLVFRVEDGFPTFDEVRIVFSDSSFSSDYGYGGYISNAILEDNLLTIGGRTVTYTNSGGFGYVSNYWYLSFYPSSQKVLVSSVDYNEFVVSGDSSPFVASPYIPPVPPTPVDYVHEIVEILTAGIVNLGSGIGQGISSFVQSLAFNSAGDGLSVYFVMVCVFGGLALAVGLTSKIFMWLSNLGS